jgi:hypothetical protein
MESDFAVSILHHEHGGVGMSHFGTETGTSYQHSDLSKVREAILSILDGDDFGYVKSNAVANETGLTTRAAGRHISTLRDSDEGLDVSRWGDTGPVWYIEVEE